jgi:transcriptional regulator with XRE-family HTH domain
MDEMTTDNLQKTLAENLLRELQARGWTKSELAERCKWPPSRVSELLAGRFDPRLGTVEKIALALDIPVSHLLTPLAVSS